MSNTAGRSELTLEQALPRAMVGEHHGWLTQYRRYPVYGATWRRLRLRPTGLGLLTMLLVIVGGVATTSVDLRALGGVVSLLLQWLLPLSLGPWLALRIRQKRWPSVLEGRLLVATMLAVSVGTTLLMHVASEPLKQLMAELTGAVDADGKRKVYRMMIGIMVSDGTDERLPGSDGAARGSASPGTPPLLSVNSLVSTAISFWLAGGLALWGWRREVQSLQALQREAALAAAQTARREAEMRLSVLAAQVEPHFLFNTLAGVRSAISTDPQRASELVDRLVDYLRASIPRLRADGSLQATVGAQCEIVQAYFALMHSRLPRMSFSLAVPAELKAARCPPLMLISLAENAVKHGVEPKIGLAEVRLEVSSPHPGRLRLAVMDNGVGFGESGSGSGLGLTNIRARLEQLYGDAAQLTLHARPDGGVVAALELPLEFAAASDTPGDVPTAAATHANFIPTP